MSDRYPFDRSLASPENALPAVAGGGILVWVVLEFALRRGLGPRLADLAGSAVVAEGLVFVVGFPAIAAVVAWLGVRAGLGRSAWDYDASLRALAAGLGGVAVYWVGYLAALFLLVAALGIEFPTDPGGGGEAATWALTLLFLGNAVVVPIAEELAWRGVVQTALTEAYGVAVGVSVTALAFVAKHLVVDLAAPLPRVASLVVLAVVLGGLRARWGTASSTVAHLVVNLVATAPMLFV